MADTDDELDPVIVAGANRAFTDNGRKLAVGAGVIINHHRLSSRLPPMANLILVIVVGADRLSTADTLKLGAVIGVVINHRRLSSRLPPMANLSLVIVLAPVVSLPMTSSALSSLPVPIAHSSSTLEGRFYPITSDHKLGISTDEAVDRCRRPHTSTPPSPSCMGEREAKTDDNDQRSLMRGFSGV
ncbi:hypothetical protein OsJ_33611 [Oryza sativa Japonica Group]|uniref:Uncharacterized protein n=3 Tax=Oryza sativa subsp. japonica TaxID=39947 RepID=A0A8J8YSF6_ORYSJ|nr:hypothetical protein LOC_Os11g17360 [Oryza sativa Japonica Group]EAZ18065.1 hypothetical protein OsJ_33611 [Oryza sativa Japonica Group]